MDRRTQLGKRTRAALTAGAVLAAGILWAAPAATAASTGSISGTVTNRGGDPISGIEIYAYVAGTTQIAGEVNSAANGTYSVPDLATGSYDLYYFPSGPTGSWLSGWYKHATSEATATPVTVTAPRDTHIDITVRPAGTIDGTVTDRAADPVSGIEIYAFVAGTTQIAGEVNSAANGTYSVPDLATGSYDLYYFPSGSTGSWLSGWYKHATSEATAVPVSVTVPNVSTADIRLRQAATISGTVTDSANSPVAGIDVYAYLSGTNQVAWEATTSTDGTFSELNLSAGGYELYYFSASGSWKKGWYRNAKTQAKATQITVTPPQTKTVQIVVQPTH
jgi:hypothetical protein